MIIWFLGFWLSVRERRELRRGSRLMQQICNLREMLNLYATLFESLVKREKLFHRIHIKFCVKHNQVMRSRNNYFSFSPQLDFYSHFAKRFFLFIAKQTPNSSRKFLARLLPHWYENAKNAVKEENVLFENERLFFFSLSLSAFFILSRSQKLKFSVELRKKKIK